VEITSEVKSRKPMKLRRATAIREGASGRAILPVLCVCLVSLSSCVPEKPGPSALGRGRMTQVSIINALMIGQYGGVMPITELLRLGDFDRIRPNELLNQFNRAAKHYRTLILYSAR
jgi:hypothetical protein